MRIIDADALRESLFESSQFDTYNDYSMVIDTIDLAPTIEERKKGKWIIEEINKYELSYGTTAYEPVYRCAVCDRLTASYLRLDEPIMPEEADFPRFCPWCGAKMEVEK